MMYHVTNNKEKMMTEEEYIGQEPEGNLEGNFKGPVDRRTKAELVEVLEAVSGELQSVQDELADRDAELLAVKATPKSELDGGWLISTPNPTYSGVTLGVAFHNGRAFVSKIAKRHGLSAEWIVKELEHDFGYMVEVLDKEQVMRMREQSQEMEQAVSLDAVKQMPASPYPPSSTPTILGEE